MVIPSGLPASAVAHGSLVSTLGTDLGPAAGANLSSHHLEPELAGVSVEVIHSQVHRWSPERGMRYSGVDEVRYLEDR